MGKAFRRTRPAIKCDTRIPFTAIISRPHKNNGFFLIAPVKS